MFQKKKRSAKNKNVSKTPGYLSTQAIQVTYLLNNENLDREISGLQEVLKEYNLPEGLLLYYDTEIRENRLPKEIKPMPVWKWLLSV